MKKFRTALVLALVAAALVFVVAYASTVQTNTVVYKVYENGSLAAKVQFKVKWEYTEYQARSLSVWDVKSVYKPGWSIQTGLFRGCIPHNTWVGYTIYCDSSYYFYKNGVQKAYTICVQQGWVAYYNKFSWWGHC